MRISFTREELRRLILIGKTRYARTNAASGGYDPKSNKARTGSTISVQGVIGEAAWFRLTGRSDAVLDDTTPRSEAHTKLMHDEGRDDCIELADGEGGAPLRVLVDVKTVVQNEYRDGSAALHIKPIKETAKNDLIADTMKRQKRKEAPPHTLNVYVLMAIRNYTSTKDFDMNVCEANEPPAEMSVDCVGWVDSNDVWRATDGELCDVRTLYKSNTPCLYYVVRKEHLKPWVSVANFDQRCLSSGDDNNE